MSDSLPPESGQMPADLVELGRVVGSYGVRGWIKVETRGTFTRKVRHATSYRLMNEANGSPGDKPSKPYMTWRPTENEKTR